MTSNQDSAGEPTPAERLAALLAEQAALTAEIAEITSPDAASKAVVPLDLSGATPAEVTREQMALVRAEVMKKQQRLTALAEEMRIEMERQQSAARALMAPLAKQVAQLNEGLWFADLYLGVGEEIVTLLEGAPAPADTPFSLRQEVLSMDEETAAHAGSGGIDARDLDVFDEWIVQPENLARVLPEPKGVVVLVPRARGRDYLDPWMNKQMDEANKWSYSLIRNGERLARLRTDFVVGKHLIPRTDEFTSMFIERRFNHATGQHEAVPLLPGTHEWERAAERQDARQRHYMRMALILQGLVDRSLFFHPLPAHGLNLLDMRTYDDGRAHLVLDAEKIVTDGREPFYDWLRRLNESLRVGMRIMGVFDTDAFKEAGDEYSEPSSRGPGYYHPNDRISPRASNRWGAEKPRSQTLYRLEGRKTVAGTQGLYFRFDRTVEREYRDEWGNREYRAPKTKATCTIFPSDRFVLPFDLATVADMRYYLGSRTNRHAYEHLFPLLKAAIAAKEAEAAEEAPFRSLLATELAKADPSLDDGTPDLPAAHTALDPLVTWWKVGNKHHRALTGDPSDPSAKDSHEAKAIREIVAEHLARTTSTAATAGDDAAEAAMVARLQALDPTIFAVFRKRDGGYLAFAPQPRAYPAHAVSHRSWTREYTSTKTGRTIKTREWILIGARTEGLRALHLDEDRWNAWDRFTSPNEDLTDPEIETLTDGLMDRVLDEVRTGWKSYGWWDGTRTRDPLDVLPLAVVLNRREGNQHFEVWMTDAADPAPLAAGPKADTTPHRAADLSFDEHYVTIGFTKSAKTGAVLAPREDWSLRQHDGDRYSAGGSAARPWRYVWQGRERGPGEIVTFVSGQDHATARTERIKAFRQAEADAQAPTTTALRVVGRGIRAIIEKTAYDTFIAEYVDPDLWPGHVANLRKRGYGDPFEPSFASGRYYRGVPDTLTRALDMLTDAGISHQGHTVRSAVEAAGLDPAVCAAEFEEQWAKKPIDGEVFMDLPVWADDLAAVDDDHLDEVDDDEDLAAVDDDHLDDEDDPDFDDDGIRVDDDGTVIVSGSNAIVGVVVDEPEAQSAVPAVVDELEDR